MCPLWYFDCIDDIFVEVEIVHTNIQPSTCPKSYDYNVYRYGQPKVATWTKMFTSALKG